MQISFRYFIQSIYLSDNPDHGMQDFDYWLDRLTYKELSEYGEEYLDSCDARIWHLFNIK